MVKRMPVGNFNDSTEGMGFFEDCDKHPFNNDATDFDVANAWWMAEHSRLAYVKSKSKVTKKLKKIGYTDVKYIWNDDTGTKAYIAWSKDHVVLSFTGTEIDSGPEDCLTDLEFFPQKSDIDGLVHSGFHDAFVSVWDEIETVLKHLGKKTIWITGHSLGGALATLAASRIEAKACYTFGSPRVGSKKFNSVIKTPVYRVVKNNDIVTRVPTPPIYRHAGDVYFITNKQEILKNPGSLRRFKERIGGSETRILWNLFKIIIMRSPTDFLKEYILGHNLYNYSVFMWNNLDNEEEL